MLSNVLVRHLDIPSTNRNLANRHPAKLQLAKRHPTKRAMAKGAFNFRRAACKGLWRFKQMPESVAMRNLFSEPIAIPVSASGMPEIMMPDQIKAVSDRLK
jgi:hypothetical protein